MTEYRLVYDSGSKLLKCAIANSEGKVISLRSYKPEVIKSEDGFQREWNYKNYWDKLLNLTKITIKSADINPKDIKYITASSIRPSCVFADDNNDAVYIGASFELRGIDYAEEIEDEFYELTGKSLYQSSGHFPSLLFIPARYRYFKEEKSEKERFEKITQYIPLESWILIKFGGEIHTNFLSAGESGFFDLKSKLWHPAWEDILELPDYFFPWPVLPGEVIGYVNEQFQKEVGFDSDTKLVAGCPDTQAALLGTQAINPGNITAVLGTTTPVQAVTEELIIPSEETLWCGLMMIKNLCNYYYIEANTGMTGQILKWACNFFYSDENISLNEKFQRLDNAYNKYDKKHSRGSINQTEEDVVYSLLGPAPLSNTQMGMAPGIFSFQSPGGVDELVHKKEDFIAAIFDNIQFAVTRNIFHAKRAAKIERPSISIVGGVTRNKVLIQRFSDLLDLPIISSENYETSINGMLTLCEIAAGNVKNLQDLKNRNENLNLLQKFFPRKKMKSKLHAKYQNWLNLFKQYYK